ncbi:MAG: hypothetical protein ACSHWZ_18795 [Sulfitobacter sp.]|uniref:hypothetical protein n=1 Tax=Celeribacter marinus TaxID=1397108 RepID=UPI00317F924B
MNEPSKQWQQIRRATLDRVRRQVIDPMQPLTTLFVTTVLLYSAGFVRLNMLAETGQNYTWLDALQILGTAVSGLLLLILSGAVMTLGFMSTKLAKVAQGNEAAH